MRLSDMIVVIFITALFLSIIFGTYSCSAYLTSGEVGRDIGEFVGDIRKGSEGA